MKLQSFQVTNYRNIQASGQIAVGDITAFVGQNEAGKSNLFEALYRINPFAPNEEYNIDEDWPVDDWGNKDASALVCQATFDLAPEEIRSLYKEARIPTSALVGGNDAGEDAVGAEAEGDADCPLEIRLIGTRSYREGPQFAVEARFAGDLDGARVDTWAKAYAPKFVLIQDYGLSGTQIELNQLNERLKNVQ